MRPAWSCLGRDDRPVPFPVRPAHSGRIGPRNAEPVRHAPNGLRESAARSSAHHSRLLLATGPPSHDEFGHLTTAPAGARQPAAPPWQQVTGYVDRLNANVATSVELATRATVCSARSTRRQERSGSPIAQETKLGGLETPASGIRPGMSRSANVRGHRAPCPRLPTGQEFSAYGPLDPR